MTPGLAPPDSRDIDGWWSVALTSVIHHHHHLARSIVNVTLVLVYVEALNSVNVRV